MQSCFESNSLKATVLSDVHAANKGPDPASSRGALSRVLLAWQPQQRMALSTVGLLSAAGWGPAFAFSIYPISRILSCVVRVLLAANASSGNKAQTSLQLSQLLTLAGYRVPKYSTQITNV